MKFGIFDQNDAGILPFAEHYEARLQLCEAYDRLGFTTYHLSEHHATPLSFTPSTGVFLSAVAQRTKQLRFGPLVYILPLRHPLQLAEEICMLDQMSGGRFELGIGRGAVPHELRHHGVDPAVAVPMYREALEVLLQALSRPEVNFEGRFYTYNGVPMVLAPVQRPHPPLWYGVSAADAAVWPAQNAVNIVCNGPVGRVAEIAARYKAEWAAAGKQAATLPCIGLSRAVVIGETDAEALETARIGWRRYHESFYVLWKKHGSMPQYARTPEDYAEMVEAGTGFAGSVATVRDALLRQARETSVNYVVSRFAFGDIPPAQALRSATLFAQEIMPALRELEETRHVA